MYVYTQERLVGAAWKRRNKPVLPLSRQKKPWVAKGAYRRAKEAYRRAKEAYLMAQEAKRAAAELWFMPEWQKRPIVGQKRPIVGQKRPII